MSDCDEWPPLLHQLVAHPLPPERGSRTFKTVMKLVEIYERPRHMMPSPNSALLYSISQCLWHVASFLVRQMSEKGASSTEVDFPDKRYHRSPLSWAARYGKQSLVDLLLRKMTNPNSRDKFKNTPLSLAAREGYENIIELLLDQEGVGPNDKEKFSSLLKSLIWTGARNGHVGVVRTLHQRGADPETRNESGMTLLMVASVLGHERIVEYLLSTPDVNVNMTNAKGQTPLCLAASSKYIAIVKLLLRGKARVQIGDRRGLTPLDRARIAGAKDVVLLLKGYLNTARSNNDDSTEVCETGRFNTADKPSIAETIQYPGTLRIGQPEGPRPSWLPMMLRDHLRVGAKTSIFGDKLEFFPKEVLLRCLNRESVATDLGKNLESSFAEDAIVKIFPVVGKGPPYIITYAILTMMDRQRNIHELFEKGVSDLCLSVLSSPAGAASQLPNGWSEHIKRWFTLEQWKFCQRVFDTDRNKGLKADSCNDNEILPFVKWVVEEDSIRRVGKINSGGLVQVEIARSSLCGDFQALLSEVS